MIRSSTYYFFVRMTFSFLAKSRRLVHSHKPIVQHYGLGNLLVKPAILVCAILTVIFVRTEDPLWLPVIFAVQQCFLQLSHTGRKHATDNRTSIIRSFTSSWQFEFSSPRYASTLKDADCDLIAKNFKGKVAKPQSLTLPFAVPWWDRHYGQQPCSYPWMAPPPWDGALFQLVPWYRKQQLH